MQKQRKICVDNSMLDKQKNFAAINMSCAKANLQKSLNF